jgi:hypothetical protein
LEVVVGDLGREWWLDGEGLKVEVMEEWDYW